jgi:hypothetical protein
MNRALVSKNNWSQSNTQVVYNQEENRSSVYLHGHEIACYDHNTNSIQLDSCGYETNTTKSRLNAILDEVKYGAKVFQRNWTWFVSYNNTTQTFDNGMILT